MKISHIEDYYTKVQEKYPELTLDEIDKILKHGWRSVYQLNNRNADVILKSKMHQCLFFFGSLFNSKKDTIDYSLKKWRTKCRIQYHYNNKVWDGYYYFGLTENDYQKYFSEKSKRKNLSNIALCKSYKESMIMKDRKYCFRVKRDADAGMVYIEKSIPISEVELFCIRKYGNTLEMVSHEEGTK